MENKEQTFHETNQREKSEAEKLKDFTFFFPTLARQLAERKHPFDCDAGDNNNSPSK